ncbi:MAG: adenylate/guanylate cyclase domain-containing protein, partial [Spirochaetes bacterium]|nr:adenylate/guanylate cyclase domain-containing protein [Spirochaetota bacterium]
VLASSLLSDFGTTLLRAIMDNGGALADRTASIVKTNISDRIALDDYLAIESKKNEQASFPFQSVSYYRRDPKTGAFSVRSSTDEASAGLALDAASAAAVSEAAEMLESESSIEFRAPVTLSGVNLGFVSVVYDRQTIYGPYYLTRVKAAIISFLFLYVSVFVTYLFGRSIVFPILFLRMGVNSISSRLSSMVKGESRVSADNLRYDDRVETKDEIKKLSVEIGNMAAVIRGVVPYISTSTLKHSEKGVPSTERRDLAFLFTDIRGFTTICEGLSPEDVVAMLNHYLDIQAEAITANGGDIDKFVGDEVMAVFDGPDKELKACRAGMDIRKAMAEAQEKARSESGAIVSIGIGINSGPVVFGSVGARERMDFTSIGDTVNLAARLEGANKTYGTKSLVTEAVYEKVKDVFICREIDLIAVKGKTMPARIFEVLQDSSKAAPKLAKIKEGFEAGLAAYRAKRWASAKKLFGKVRDAYGDEASDVFYKRIEVFEASPPPADWDGVFRMTVK